MVSRGAVAPLVAAALVATWALVVGRTLPPEPLPIDAPATAFSATRAARHVEAIAIEPHPTGSAANRRVREYVAAELARLGIPAEERPDGDLVNLVARIPGQVSTDAVLLTAHYDSTAQSPGATDDASGVAALLETARALRASVPARNTVMFLFTDHEEGGTLGASAFIARDPWAADVRVVVGLDAGGTTGPGVLSATSPDAGWLVRQWLASDPDVVGSSAVNALASSNTDFGRAFEPAGFPGYAFDLYWDIRDAAEETPANLDRASLQHQGGHALSLARRFAAMEPLEVAREPDLVFFNVLRLFTVSYPSAWATPLAIGIAGLLVLLLAGAMARRRVSVRGLALGAVVSLVGVGLAPLPLLLLTLLVGPFEPRVTADWGYRLLDQPAVMAVIATVSLALVVTWHRFVRRRRPTSLAELALGALLPLAAGLLGSSIVLPGLSFAFAWPLLAAVVVAAAMAAGADPGSSPVRLVGLIAAGAVAIVVAGPTIVLGMFDQPVVALASLGALCGFLVPQLHLALGDRGPW
jgi:hypothetical protein